MDTVISVKRLSKKFVAYKNRPGIKGALLNLFLPIKNEITAIRDLSFLVKEQERCAFIGPNGAGKSTTIKMLTGILHPSCGDMEVLGCIPWKERKKLGYQIGTVFGQRSQLWYHLPPSDSFDLLAKIYEIDPVIYQKRLKEMIDLFELKSLLHKPVRGLSLGERMRCEIVASVLHRPKVLFLDEPTIGLDINAKLTIRGLLKKLTEDHGTTLFLTSHDTADIEQVADRVLVLDQGTLIWDSSLKDLKKKYPQHSLEEVIRILYG